LKFSIFDFQFSIWDSEQFSAIEKRIAEWMISIVIEIHE